MPGMQIGINWRPASDRVSQVNEGEVTDPQHAHTTLENYSAHLAKRGGGIKDGVLRLRQGASGETRIYRDRFYHFRSRSRDQGVKDAGLMTKELFSQAYKDKLPASAFKSLMAGLDAYLTSRQGQMGTRTFAKFFNAFEAAANRQAKLDKAVRELGGADGEQIQPISEESLANLLGHTGTDPLVAKISSPQSRQEEAREQARVDVERGSEPFVVIHRGGAKGVSETQAQEGTAKALALGQDRVNPIGGNKGATALAFLVQTEDLPKTVVTVPRQQRDPITDDSFGTGELAAASARASMPHVSKPTEFVLKVTVPSSQELSHETGESKNIVMRGDNTQAYRVPAGQVRSFFQSTQEVTDPKDVKPLVSVAAVRMPAGPLTTLSTAMNKQPLDDRSFTNLASGLYLALCEMGSAGLVHHDLKSDNVVFDKDTGQVMLIDMGGAVRLDENGRTTVMNERNETTRHPLVEPNIDSHGLEFDRYSFAVMLMITMSPKIERSLVHKALASVCKIQDKELGDGGRVGALLHVLRNDESLASIYQEPTKSEELQHLKDVAADLEARFEKDPKSRELLEQCLKAGLTTGDESQREWNQVGSLLFERSQGIERPNVKDQDELRRINAAFRSRSERVSENILDAGDPGRQLDGPLNSVEADVDPYSEESA